MIPTTIIAHSRKIIRKRFGAKLHAIRGQLDAMIGRRHGARRLPAGRLRFEGAVLTFSRNWLGTFDTRAEFDFFESGKRKRFWRTVTIWVG